jgi:hypothetical protein
MTTSVLTPRRVEQFTVKSTFTRETDSDSDNSLDIIDEKEVKILELNNEILQLKTFLSKKNKKIEELERVIQAYKKLEESLVITKNDLVKITKSIRDSKSCRGSNPNSTYGDNKSNFDSRSFNNLNILPTSTSLELRVKNLNEMNGKLQLTCNSMEMELEQTKASSSRLRKRVEEQNILLLENERNYQLLQGENYSLKQKLNQQVKELENKIIMKSENKREFYFQFLNLFYNNVQIFNDIQIFLEKLTEENRTNFHSELFESGLDFNNLNIQNYQIYLKKIQNLNFIFQLDEGMNLDQIYFKGAEFYIQNGKTSEAKFIEYFNTFISKLLTVFEQLIKNLIVENNKIFYFTNTISILMKRLLTDKYELMKLNNSNDVIEVKI